jgi:tetratricopeptide (TPR) repeat protein
VVAGASLVMWALPAQAQSEEAVVPEVPAAPDEARFDAAKAARDKAEAAYTKGDVEAALAHAEAAYAAYPNASTALLRAVLLSALERREEAFAAYLVAANLESAAEQEPQALRDGLQRQGQRLGMGVLTVAAVPATAQVTVGATALPPRVRTVGLRQGRHAVRIAAPGLREEVREVTVVAGERLRLEVTLTAAAAAGPSGGAEAGGGSALGVSGRADDGSGGPPAWVGWTLVGGGVALAAVGGAMFGLAVGSVDDIAALGFSADYDRRYEALADSVREQELAGWVLTGVGVAALVAGAVVLALPGEGGREDDDAVGGPTLGVVPLAGGAAAAVTGRW